ncbi:MAG: FAD-dependent monooxygenase [Solirubrobacterales bacterium]
MSPSREADVTVVGAGLAGLIAARETSSSGAEVLVARRLTEQLRSPAGAWG